MDKEIIKQRALECASQNGLLTFSLGEQEFAVDIIKVQEIRGYEPVTQIANLPKDIKGIINMRGNIVPIIDLRIKFGLVKFDYSATTIVVILSLVDRLMGIVVDAVSDVIEISPEHIKPPPDFGETIDICYLLGLAIVDERMIALVDIEALLANDKMRLLESTPA
ncbi:chemotaxis protein CheW [Deefgea tanakiae]|uniref:Chemotaxis protein CheW n=1 Tax=Deefgea tanakiae TaxID=2865840 RepID=A0ABX8ZA24_9NEIS|nr:chemotaxis protein CheW [Deefgea tanakiae]QZA78665.1 chemotaxis protein CheW [Deefgea tanakiae]